MAADDTLLPALTERIRKLEARVAQLLRRRPDTGAHNLDELDDFEALYKHWTRLPRHDQAARWDTTRESPFGGLGSFRDPTVEARAFEEPITGAGDFMIDEDLVPSDWGVDRPCLVSVTVDFTAAYTPVEYSPPTSPATYLRPPMMTFQVHDADGGAVAPGPTPGYEVATATWPVVEQYPNAATPHGAESRSWLFKRGLPHLVASCHVDPDVAAGIAGLGPYQQLTALTRVTRL